MSMWRAAQRDKVSSLFLSFKRAAGKEKYHKSKKKKSKHTHTHTKWDTKQTAKRTCVHSVRVETRRQKRISLNLSRGHAGWAPERFCHSVLIRE